MQRSTQPLTLSLGLLALVIVSPLQAWQQQAQQVRPANAQPQQLEIMAVVNGQQITRDQLAREAMARFGESVTESIVNKFLITLECQRQGIQVSEADVDAEIEKRAKKFGMSADRYVNLICRERDLAPAKLRNEIIWTELALRSLAASMTQVADEEVQQRLESEFGPKVQVRAIA